MSIINNAHKGSQFEVLIAIYQTLVGNKGETMSKEELLSWVRPEQLTDKDSARQKADGEITAWVELGLLEETAEGISLHKQAFAESEIPLATAARRCLLSQTNNQDLNTRDQRAADLTVLLCFLLSLDVYRYPQVQSSNLTKIVNNYLDDFRINHNETNIVPSYTHWLGFMTRIGNNKYAIDPTQAICGELAALNLAGQTLTIDDFIQKLGKVLPVLDGGQYRLQIEQRMEKFGWHKPKDNEISTSLSRALLRLSDAQEFELLSLGDAKKSVLLGANNKELMSVSHVKFEGES